MAEKVQTLTPEIVESLGFQRLPFGETKERYIYRYIIEVEEDNNPIKQYCFNISFRLERDYFNHDRWVIETMGRRNTDGTICENVFNIAEIMAFIAKESYELGKRNMKQQFNNFIKVD